MEWAIHTRKKPRIALMSYSMDNRGEKGTAVYTRKLIERLLEDDRFEWYLVHYERVDDQLYKKAREIVMPRVTLPFATHFVRQLLFFWKYRNEGFDIIHWFQPRLYPLFWLAPARTLVVTAHGAGDITAVGHFPLSRRVFNFVLKHFNCKLDAIIAVSEFGKQEVVEYYGASSDRVHAILLGGGERSTILDKHKARELVQNKFGIGTPFILDVARLMPHKNVDTVILAYDRYRDMFPERKEALVIVGWQVLGYEKTYALARESRYAADIRFIGFVPLREDLDNIYAAADLFLFPSLNEGFGLPVIEAFAAGTPVITSNVTSLPEIAGDAALIVDPLDVDAIADAIYRVLSDTRLATDLVDRGRRRAMRFTWDDTASQTLDLYKKILCLEV